MARKLGSPFSLEDLRKIDALIHPSVRDAASAVPGGVVLVDILNLIVQTPGILEEALGLLKLKGALPHTLGSQLAHDHGYEDINA